MRADLIPSCCGARMRISDIKDEVECLTCKRTVSGQEMYAGMRHIFGVDLAPVEYRTMLLLTKEMVNAQTQKMVDALAKLPPLTGDVSGIVFKQPWIPPAATKAPRDPNRGPYVTQYFPSEPESAAFKARAAALAELRAGGKPTGVSSTYGPGKPVDPLDVEYDGVTLRDLLEFRQCVNREIDIGAGTACSISWRNADPWTATPAQRAAVSAHWSAQLRAKVQASEAAVKARSTSVVIGVDAEDLPW